MDDWETAVRRRFFSKVKVDPDTDCWLWTGTKSGAGYGRISVDGRKYAAHRISYVLAGGSIPAGQVLDHLCRAHDCVNPDHLEPVSNLINVTRGRASDRSLKRWVSRR